MNLDDITKQDISDVRKGLVKCGDLIEMVKRGMACGVDCEDIKQQAEMAWDFLTKVNEMYGPQFPSKTA